MVKKIIMEKLSDLIRASAGASDNEPMTEREIAMVRAKKKAKGAATKRPPKKTAKKNAKKAAKNAAESSKKRAKRGWYWNQIDLDVSRSFEALAFLEWTAS
jgi:hypothetical protein